MADDNVVETKLRKETEEQKSWDQRAKIFLRIDYLFLEVANIFMHKSFLQMGVKLLLKLQL